VNDRKKQLMVLEEKDAEKEFALKEKEETQRKLEVRSCLCVCICLLSRVCYVCLL
jgi:hypothetical protein